MFPRFLTAETIAHLSDSIPRHVKAQRKQARPRHAANYSAEDMRSLVIAEYHFVLGLPGDAG